MARQRTEGRQWGSPVRGTPDYVAQSAAKQPHQKSSS